MQQIPLKVKVMEGKALIAADFGGTSDPFCEIKVGNLKPVKTKVIKKTVSHSKVLQRNWTAQSYLERRV